MNAAPSENPYTGPVVLFDGYCKLCNAWVSFLLAHDHQRRFRFATIQSDRGQALIRRLAPMERIGESIVFAEDDRVFTRSSAALRILQGLGFPWALAAILRLVPVPIRDAGYNFVARNRYRWFGRTTTCRLPTPAERDQFLS